MVTRYSRRYLAVFGLLTLVSALLIGANTLPAGAQPNAPQRPADGVEALPPNTVIQTVLTNMDRPVAMAFDPAGRLFYTEKVSGKVRLYANGALQSNAVITFNVNSVGERGLLGIAIDPNFNANRYIYVYYTCGDCSNLQNRVVRFVENGGVGSNPTTIFSSAQSAGNHVGGNIHFGPDGKLYVSVGDNNVPSSAQNANTSHGKIHRINPDGTIPADNPIFTPPGVATATYAVGLRNSFDFTFDPLTPSRMFASENGPGCDDEMNRIERGYNYGWRADYPCDDANPAPPYNTIPPLWYLSTAQCCEAPTGITVYTGHISPWRNDLFMASYNTGALRHFYLSADRTRVTAANVVQGVTANMDLETGPDGDFWYIEGGGYASGTLKRVVNTGCRVLFNDVQPSSGFHDWVQCLACRGIVSGYADGTFRPNSPITRAQLSKIISNAASITDPIGGQIFEDVPSSNAFYEWIQRLSQRGYISGYQCGGAGEPCVSGKPYFRPNAQATRAQISKIVSNAALYNDTPSGQLFQDVPTGHAFYTWVQRLASRSIMSGYPCGGPGEPCVAPDNRSYFRPHLDATRGQVSKITANAFYPNCAIR